MDLLTFTPQDTLFFRDGRPFDQEDGSAYIPGLFPPSPETLVGAARASWAKKSRKWSGKGREQWSDELSKLLGGDDDQLANNIRFSGPIVLYNKKPVYPVPCMLLGENGKTDNMVLLAPSRNEMETDLGWTKLPEPQGSAEGMEQISDYWLTENGLGKLLDFQLPDKDDFIEQGELFQPEPRVGIQLDPKSRTTKNQALYAILHSRCAEAVNLAMGVENAPFQTEGFTPLGGEARYVWLEHLADTPLPVPEKPEFHPDSDGCVRYTVHILSPYAPKAMLKPNQGIEGLPGTLVSACLLRPQRWGGWDSVNFKPKPARPHIPPGSVLFMEANADEIERIKQLHGTTIGQRSSWGFGLITTGIWKQRSKA